MIQNKRGLILNGKNMEIRNAIAASHYDSFAHIPPYRKNIGAGFVGNREGAGEQH